MKRRKICICQFVLYGLVVCLLLSQKIQMEMTTRVVLRPVIITSKSTGIFTLSLDCIYQQENQASLLKLEEGSGWADGPRVRLVEDSYTVDTSRNEIQLIPTRDCQIIRHASRFPVIGAPAAAVEQTQVPDEYLLLYPSDPPEYVDPGDGITLLAEGANARLLALEQAESPFLPDQAAEKLYRIGGERCQIVSLRETAQLIKCLPYVALLAAVLWMMLVTWVRFICRIKDMTGRGILLRGTILLLLMAILALLLRSLSLPASVLPPENILDWNHYTAQLQLVCTALRDIGLREHDLLTLRARVIPLSGTILIVFFLITLLPTIHKKRLPKT